MHYSMNSEGESPVRKAMVDTEKIKAAFKTESDLYCFNLVYTADSAMVTFSVEMNYQ